MHDLAGQIRVRYPHDMAGQIEAWKQIRRNGVIHAITGLVTASLCVWVFILSAVVPFEGIRPEMRGTFVSIAQAFFILAAPTMFTVAMMWFRAALDANAMLGQLRGACL